MSGWVVGTTAAGTQVAEVIKGCEHVIPSGDIEAFKAIIEAVVDDLEARGEFGVRGSEDALLELSLDAALGRFEEEVKT